MAKRVLVVAGREGVAPAFQVQIELWGKVLDFTLAASGNEALWEVRGSPYDLVLAPWQLPEMTGIELAEIIRELSPATRVVLVGVKVTPALRNRARSLGIYALLPEASPQEVAALIGRALEVPLPRPPRAKPEPEPTPPPAQVVTRPAEAPPAAQPAPPPPTVKLNRKQQDGVRRALRDLVVSVGPQVALLADMAGHVLVLEGTTGDLDMEALSDHAAAGLAGSDDLAALLNDQVQLGLFLLVGDKYDTYAFTITAETLLLFVFDKSVGEVKLGSVWLYTRRVVDDLREILS